MKNIISTLSAGTSVNSIDRRTFVDEMGILKTSCVSAGVFNQNEHKTIVPQELDKASINPKKDRIIMSRMNTPSLVGASAFIDRDYKDLFLPDRLWQLEPKDSAVSMRWLSYVLGSERYKYQLSSLATGTSNSMKNITKSDVFSIHLDLPPLPEQKKIARILSTWDLAIEKLEALIVAKQKRKKALTQQLLTGKKRCSEFVHSRGYRKEKTYDLPNDWLLKKASEIFCSVSKKGYPKEELLSATQEHGVIPRDMLSGKVTMPSNDRSSFKLVEKGDFVISLRSFQGGIEYSDYRGIVSPAYTVLKPKIPISDHYFKYLFKSYDFISRLAVTVIGIRDGKQISYNDFSALYLPYPEKREQEKIANIFILIDKEIELHQKQLEAHKRQKKGIMQQLLSGKKRVTPDPEDCT